MNSPFVAAETAIYLTEAAEKSGDAKALNVEKLLARVRAPA